MTKQTSQLTDAQRANKEYLDCLQDAWRIPGRVADAVRRKKQYYNAAGQQEGSSVEEEENDAVSDSGAWRHDRRRRQTTTHEIDPERRRPDDDPGERATSDKYSAAIMNPATLLRIRT